MKVVAVLNSKEGVSGTIYFAEEGDGKLKIYLVYLGVQ